MDADSDGDHRDDQPAFWLQLRWVTSHYFHKTVATLMVYPTFSCRPARAGETSLTADIYMGRRKCATGRPRCPRSRVALLVRSG